MRKERHCSDHGGTCGSRDGEGSTFGNSTEETEGRTGHNGRLGTTVTTTSCRKRLCFPYGSKGTHSNIYRGETIFRDEKESCMFFPDTTLIGTTGKVETEVVRESMDGDEGITRYESQRPTGVGTGDTVRWEYRRSTEDPLRVVEYPVKKRLRKGLQDSNRRNGESIRVSGT